MVKLRKILSYSGWEIIFNWIEHGIKHEQEFFRHKYSRSMNFSIYNSDWFLMEKYSWKSDVMMIKDVWGFGELNVRR